MTIYKGMELHPLEGGAVYGFLGDPEEQDLLERVLPNKLREELKDCHGKIKTTINICYKHFRADYPKEKKQK